MPRSIGKCQLFKAYPFQQSSHFPKCIYVCAHICTHPQTNISPNVGCLVTRNKSSKEMFLYFFFLEKKILIITKAKNISLMHSQASGLGVTKRLNAKDMFCVEAQSVSIIIIQPYHKFHILRKSMKRLMRYATSAFLQS